MKLVSLILVCLLSACATKPVKTSPQFVSLHDFDPSIKMDIRYASPHNFVGRPIVGYGAAKCLLTRQAAEALAKVQADLKPQGFSLKVYDCYRPQRAVNDFANWAKDIADQKMKAEFYPRIPKEDSFKLGYIALQSGHSRGSTMDLTLVSLKGKAQARFIEGQKLEDCAGQPRFADDTIEMGTGYDCFDPLAHTENPSVAKIAMANRLKLKAAMEKRGFHNYPLEWWHYTLNGEPYADEYFDLIVE